MASYDSEVTFWARGSQVWRQGDIEGDMLVATAINQHWALEITKLLRGEGGGDANRVDG